MSGLNGSLKLFKTYSLVQRFFPPEIWKEHVGDAIDGGFRDSFVESLIDWLIDKNGEYGD